MGKIFRQTGTVNARMGAIRQPVRVGGGHAKQKRPKDWRQGLPKKARQLATKSAILLKIQSQDIKVVDDFKISSGKTKEMASVYAALKIERSCLFAIDGKNDVLERSARNIDRTTVTAVSQLNAWDIMRNRTLLVSKSGLQAILA